MGEKCIITAMKEDETLNFAYNKLYLFLYESPFLPHSLTRVGNQKYISSSGFQNQNRPNDNKHYPSVNKIMKSLATQDPFVIRASNHTIRKCQSWCSLDELRLNTRASLSYYPKCPLLKPAGPI